MSKVLITQDVGDLHTNPYIGPQITSYALWTLLQWTTFLKCSTFFLPSLFLIFLPYSVCKDGFTKTREIWGPEGNGVPSIYRLTHVNFNSQVFVSFLRFFLFLSLTPLHWRILYFPNAINCFFFLKQIGSVFFFLPQINVQHWYCCIYTYKFNYLKW